MKIKAQVFSGIITITIFCGLLRAQITGVTAGTDLTGGGTSGNVTLNLDTTKVPRLAAANAFSGNQSVKGNVSASGTVAGSAFMIGANLFDYGSYGNGNAFLGFGGNTSNTGAFNTATGYGSLVSLTTGSSNTAGGADALFANTTGENNTAYGESAMYSNNTGEENTAVGYAALAANQAGIGNTAAGTAAMGSNTTGTYNAALGYLALSSNLAGIGNTAVGTQSGYRNANGAYNTFVGYSATNTSEPINNATAIRANASVGESNALILGGSGTQAVAVGIGTSKPYTDYALDVETVKSNGVINGGVVVNASGGNLYLGMTNTTHKFRVDTNGVVYADGGFLASGADFAESVSVRGQRSEYEPGDVLEIDETADRNLSLSHHAYATTVAGIYSTKPGVLATAHTIDDAVVASTEVPLAVIGIVPCKVTSENGSIVRGDLLVASSRPGYAMKGTDRGRMLGAVVGKALEALPDGQGVIQVLVTLQ
jgi:hypothetical protein